MSQAVSVEMAGPGKCAIALIAGQIASCTGLSGGNFFHNVSI